MVAAVSNPKAAQALGAFGRSVENAMATGANRINEPLPERHRINLVVWSLRSKCLVSIRLAAMHNAMEVSSVH